MRSNRTLHVIDEIEERIKELVAEITTITPTER